MKTIEINLYQFSELSETAKKVAIEKMYDINVSYEWWESVYEDAANIGLKITGFDIDRASYVNAEFMLSANEVAQNIFNNHGEKCDTYNTALTFMAAWEPIFCDYMDENHENYESYESEQKMIDLEDEFLQSICEDYRIMLSNEYDYLTSKQAIIETIEANEYDFLSSGKLA